MNYTDCRNHRLALEGMDPRATFTTDIFGFPIVVTDYSDNTYDRLADSRTNPAIINLLDKCLCIIAQVINIFLLFYEYRRLIAVLTRACC
jgi:hypothetical protein